ncbi:insulin receptor substrate 1 [Manduca sexta]|uniref:insulin receptor substrate 1 n=1 Tax=Manduca sexta TaxID=7130 RepID=UPI00188FBA2F|nr:insulin receptor substrate 1 [Manduca sexta]
MSGSGAGAGAVVRQGHLRKLKTMKKKFFVLRAETEECSARLEYYESEKKFKAGAVPRRVLPLKSCFNIMRRLDLKQKHVIALFTREEQFCIVADNEQELHAWLSAILKQHRADDASAELLHPIQHVWQVHVQKKGLGASKNIQGLYNLCLTDKTLTLVKIKSHNNVISDLGIPERVEYSLKNIRRCGDSECFFYMEVGRQTSTGAGELWMLSDDSNIAQSMHSTIYHAMCNCTKETEHERDHIVMPKTATEMSNPPPARRQTYSDSGKGRSGLANEGKGLCMGACIRQCVCTTGTMSVDDSAAAIAPITAPHERDAENQPPNNPLTERTENSRVGKHTRTGSLPAGCPLFQEPLKIVHGRTSSEPLTGAEIDRLIVEKATMHSSCKAINGNDMPPKKTQWSRRASTGTRMSKLSPAHSKNSSSNRSRCDSMPSRACSSFEVERPPPRHTDLEGLEVSRDEADALAEWYRTPRIPEEPDNSDISKDFMNISIRPGGSVQHSRTSSLGLDDTVGENLVPDGYLPMAPGHDPSGGLIYASSGSVCSGTPSTDPRFSEYQLEPATSHLAPAAGAGAGSPRAYSVGSRPPPRAPEPRHRAYSVGARHRPPAHARHPLPRASAEDLMELDFSTNSPAAKASISRTPPATSYAERAKANVDEYVDMSPRNAGYVEMRPGEPPPSAPATPHTPATPATDGYVEMSYGRAATRPIAIAGARAPPPAAASPEEAKRRRGTLRETPHGSQTIFPLSLESPASPPDELPDELEEDPPHHALSTVREIAEETREGRRSPEPRRDVSSSPQYVTLARPRDEELACNPLANKTIARVEMECRPLESTSGAPVVVAGGGAPARFSVGEEKRLSASGVSVSGVSVSGVSVSGVSVSGALHYAALDLEPRRAPGPPAPRAYTQIDFLRSEQLHADTA